MSHDQGVPEVKYRWLRISDDGWVNIDSIVRIEAYMHDDIYNMIFTMVAGESVLTDYNREQVDRLMDICGLPGGIYPHD